MRWFLPLLCVLLIGRAWAQVPADQAYQRLQQRIAEKQAVAATQPAVDQIAALKTENERLRAIVADLQLQLDQLRQGQSGAAMPAAATQPSAVYVPTGRSYSGTSSNRIAATQPEAGTGLNGETQTGTTATGIPTYTGPRGGTYHYSKSGNKVYGHK